MTTNRGSGSGVAPIADGSHESRLMSIIESAMDAIITVDESQRVVMFNRAAEKLFGVPVQQALASSLDRFVPERYRKAHAGHIRAFGHTGVSTRAMGLLGTLTGLRSDGHEFPIEASISQAIVDGQRYYTVILRDVSERQKLEAKLLQSQKMEGIGRLAGGVAHDFNNMLMAIFNYLTLAARRLEPGHPSREAIAHAQEAADRAAALTRQLLAFARKQVVNPRPLSPRTVVAGLEKMLRRLIGEDVTLRTVLEEDTWNVLADPSQLEQVIVNLVVNARDAMPRGGTLTIETTNITLDDSYCRTRIGSQPGPHVMLTVTDTGEGMTQEVMNRLFEPFFTTKPQGKGTGLGLATCHGIVQQNGGHIAVYSEPGRGTSVKVFLPRNRDAAAPSDSASAPEPAPAGGTETILLAEDSDIVRDLATAALKGAGYTVLMAPDGRQAVDMAAGYAGAIDLLITDVVMPEMNGVEVAKAVTSARPHLPVIFMSGYTEETIAYHGVETDTHIFMAKPFMTDELLRKVREVLDARKRR